MNPFPDLASLTDADLVEHAREIPPGDARLAATVAELADRLEPLGAYADRLARLLGQIPAGTGARSTARLLRVGERLDTYLDDLEKSLEQNRAICTRYEADRTELTRIKGDLFAVGRLLALADHPLIPSTISSAPGSLEPSASSPATWSARSSASSSASAPPR